MVAEKPNVGNVGNVPPVPTLLKSVDEMQTDLYGDDRRGSMGVIDRLKLAENSIERLEYLVKLVKAFLVGLGVNLFLTLVTLAKLFGAI